VLDFRRFENDYSLFFYRFSGSVVWYVAALYRSSVLIARQMDILGKS